MNLGEKGVSLMSIEQNKAALRRIIEELRNGGNVAVIPGLFTPGYVYHPPEDRTREATKP